MKKSSIKILFGCIVLLIAAVVSFYIAPAMETNQFVTFAGTSLATLAAVDLDHIDGESNMPGFKMYIYIAKITDIEEFPESDSGNDILLTGAITMKTGKYFKKIYCSMEEGDLTGETVGAKDSQSVSVKASVFHPYITADSLATASAFNNTHSIVIAQLSTGQYRMLGNANLPVYVKTKETTGKKFTDAKGILFEFDWANEFHTPIYTGSIPLPSGPSAA